MPKEVILDNEYASLWYDSDLHAVRHRLKKTVPVELLRDLLARGCELMEMKGARKWLSDDRENKVVSQEIADWSLGSLRPFMLKSGWKFWAVVPPTSPLNRARMQCFVELYAKLGITTCIFSDLDEAVKWLAEQ